MRHSKSFRHWLGACALTLSAAFAGSAAAQNAAVETVVPGQLTVLFNPASPPTSFIKDGKATGMAVEIVEEIARRHNLKVEFKAHADLAGALPAVSNRQYDLAAMGLMRTPEREAVVDFSGSWYYGWFPLIVDKSAGLNGYKDLSGKTVGINKGSIQERYMLDNHPNIQLMAFPNDTAAVAALNAGKVDGVLTGSALLGETLKRFPHLTVAARTPTPYPNAFPVRKGNDSLRKALDDGLRELVKDGTYVKIFDKWHAGDALPEPMYKDYPGLEVQRAPGVASPRS
ncbi:substrate-binding periplasmic protein [Microvirga zambiensis]|uniref:substrate-binding periplasmic protein n=1 Tax=Microvirga zambiensis TaxID=1402137 RepID=UPI00191EA10B|nr:transporter substrate-binding domain-containing protein [Microvirga zambiensis]